MVKARSIGLLMLLLAFSTLPASAHVDVILPLEGGAIPGLPDAFQPARLDLTEAWLQLGATRLEFPPCVAKYLSNERPLTLELTGSWYHDTTTLPPYLSLNLTPKGRAHTFRLLFDMESLEPLSFTIAIRDSEFVTAYHEVLITDGCRASIAAGRSSTTGAQR